MENELRLDDPKRSLIRDGTLSLRKGTNGEVGVHLFLVDHVLLICKQRKKTDGLKLYKPVRKYQNLF